MTARVTARAGQENIKLCYDAPQRALNETIVIMHTTQELCKLLRFRVEDISSLERLVNPLTNSLKSSLQFVDDIILDIECRENSRILLESQKILSLEGFKTDDRDTRKIIGKSIKKIITDYERRYFFKKNVQENTLVNHLKGIMFGETSFEEQKLNISQDKKLTATLNHTVCALRPAPLKP